jgi:UDP-3-O-[3-hydroxymyristoyl] glucosamine N-acyltransferase
MKFEKEYKAWEIADLIAKEITGDKDYTITGINEIHNVSHGDITFVDHPKYYEKALNSEASLVIINSLEVENTQNKILIYSESPFDDYNFITKFFRVFVPSHSPISSNAIIGKNTIIQPNVFIGENVEIGQHCIIHANVTIYDNTIIGNNVEIHSGTVIGSDAFYYKKYADKTYTKMHSCGRVVIEDEVEIGSNCSIDKGVSHDTRIGKGSKLDNQIHIGHDTKIGKHCLFAAHVAVAGCVIIEDHVTLWGKVVVQKDLTIGANAIVLGASGVSKSIEGNKTYFGIPAQDARTKWKELAVLKKLPELFHKLKM